jgi:hypothetical protein
MKASASIAALALGVLLLSTRDAHAYLDPGLGSMLLQGLIAGLAAASVVLGRYWHKFKSFFSASADERRPSDGPGDPTGGG